jgi:hypothetical protein
MKSSTWFRALAGVFTFFAVGHTLGFLKPPADGSPAAPVYAAMQNVRFPMMGFSRTYLDFYRGFGLSVTIEFVVLALLAWQLASISAERPRDALRLSIALLVGCAGTALVSFAYFFTAPMVTSLAAVACALVACAQLAREARAMTLRRAA